MFDPPSKLQIVERRIGDITVLELTGALTLDDGDLGLRSHVHALLDEGRRKLLVDLGGVTAIDSAGVGMLVAKMKTVRERQGEMKLLHMTARSARVLRMMKMFTSFEVFDDEAVAIKSFN